MKALMLKILKKLKSYSYRNISWRLIVWIGILTVMGIKVINSAAKNKGYGTKQIFGVAAGFLVMAALMFIDYHFIMKFYQIIYVVMIGLLLAVELKGSSGGGAQRWFSIGDSIQIQPSEFAKICIIVFFAKFIMKHKAKFNTFKILIFCVILIIFPLTLVYLQPDLSTTILMALLFCSIMFLAGISYKIIFSVLGITIPAAVFLIYLISQPEQQILHGYQLNRIIAFYDSSSEHTDKLLYQQENAVMAIGSGGLWGKGLNNESADSVKNGNYLAASHTDFIFAIVGEELGFTGSICVIAFLIFIILECFYVGIHAPDIAGKIIACGYGTLVAFQAFINLSVVTMLIPNTGLTLPFVSYGLSSLLSLFIGAGIILNISLQHKKLL